MARWEQSQQFKIAESTPRSFPKGRDLKPAKTSKVVEWPNGKGKGAYPREQLSVVGFLGMLDPQLFSQLLLAREFSHVGTL
jgi:hypothetical protein